MDIITPIATIMAALAGSWAGARLAIDRFRTERGFDRRLDWYERTVRVIQNVQRAIWEAKSRPDAVNQTQVEIRWQPVSGSMNALMDVTAEGAIYADSRSVEALVAAIREWVAYATSVKLENIGSEKTEAERLKVVTELDRLLNRALGAVGTEARAHLCLEPLPQTNYFAGRK